MNKSSCFTIGHKYLTDAVACICLVLSVVILYQTVQQFEFVDYDDSFIIYENRNLQNKPTAGFIKWAFTDTATGHWHPLTWISHRIDWQCFQSWAGGHHRTNVIFHILNTLLLYCIFLWMTNERGKSFLVAFLFAVHPLNVESVAWVAERKNVLSTCWGLLTMGVYISYVKKPSWQRYLPVFLFLLAGLMSKPMLVTMPVVLLLLDYWPLGRFACPCGNDSTTRKNILFTPILEKIPLFLLSVASVVITVIAARNGGALRSLGEMSIDYRLMNVFLSYAQYIKKFIFPTDMAFYYPYPTAFNLLEVSVSVLIFAMITLLVLRKGIRYPYLPVGWLWFVITLLPVIGVIQVGFQAMADRYAYLPFIGLFIIFSWGVPDLLSGIVARERLMVALSAVIILTFMIVSWHQVQYWRNSRTLAQRALAVTTGNHMAHLLMGNVLYSEKDLKGAAFNYYEALSLRPTSSEINNNIGNVSFANGQFETARIYYERALYLNPKNMKALNNRGVIMLIQGRKEDAAASFRAALAIDPSYPSPRSYLQKMGISPDR